MIRKHACLPAKASVKLENNDFPKKGSRRVWLSSYYHEIERMVDPKIKTCYKSILKRRIRDMTTVLYIIVAILIFGFLATSLSAKSLLKYFDALRMRRGAHGGGWHPLVQNDLLLRQ